MADLSLGATIAGCRLEAVAGRGGMGVVYRATQLALERPVAVKAIAPQFAEDASFRERFQRESHLAASIDHPNVIPVYEAGERDGTLYLIMRWVEGTELRALLRSEGRLAPQRAIDLLRPVASALGAAHRRGLVHRDVKPANVLIARGDGEDEHVYLTDFGIARRLDSEGGVTRTGVLVGTLDYVAPERIEGKRGDAAADIYSFGCMLYEALTGSLPYDRPTELGKMHAHVHEPPPSVRDVAPEVPAALDAIVTRAMAKDPAARFASAGELANALTAAGDIDTVTAERQLRAEADTDETDLPTAAGATAATAAREPTRETKVVATAKPARMRPTALVAALGLFAVVAVVAVLLLAGGGGGDKGGAPAASTTTKTTAARAAAPAASGDARVDPSPAFRVTGGRPSGMALAGDRLWIAVPESGRLLGYASGQPTRSIAVGGTPQGVVSDAGGRVWVTHTGARELTVYDPTGGTRRRVTTGADPGPIAIAGGAAWVVDRGEQSLTRIDTRTLATTRVALPARPTALVSAYGRVWVVLSGGAVRALDAAGKPDPIASPPVAGAVMAGGPSHGVWFAGAIAGTRTQLTRVDPRAEVARRTSRGRVYDAPAVPPPFAGAPSDLATGTDSMWLAAARTVTHLDTNGNARKTGAVTFPAPVGRLALGDGVLWVAVPSTGRVYRVSF